MGRRAVLEYCQPALPTVILGPLIVFETLAGLLYTFLLRQSLPPLLTLSGILLLVLGVVSAVRASRKNRAAAADERKK
jgi:drug/metabolite transporter (DMT)-like permease